MKTLPIRPPTEEEQETHRRIFKLALDGVNGEEERVAWTWEHLNEEVQKHLVYVRRHETTSPSYCATAILMVCDTAFRGQFMSTQDMNTLAEIIERIQANFAAVMTAPPQQAVLTRLHRGITAMVDPNDPAF